MKKFILTFFTVIILSSCTLMEPPSQLSKETKAELLDRIYQGYQNFENEIDVTDINILDNKYDINLILDLISEQALSRYYYADVFDTLTFTSYQRSMRLATIELPYLYMEGSEIDKTKSLKVQSDTEKKLNEIVAMLDSSMSDLEKILFLHDYLITTTQYDIRPYEIAINDINNFTIQGTLNTHQTMCSGYTITLYRLLEKAGISSNMIDSQEMEHTWLTVEINNKWYHIDPTWNDTTYEEYPDTDKSIDGIALHDYFLLSDEKILIDHQQWAQLDNNTSDDLYEDNYIFNSNNSKMNYYNGYWYYTLPNNNGGYKDSKYIYYTYTYDDVITKSKIDGSDLSVIDLDCKIKQLLSNNKNMLYFFNDSGVFSYNLDTNKKQLLYQKQKNNNIIEIGLIDNNLKITYQDKNYNFNYKNITV